MRLKNLLASLSMGLLACCSLGTALAASPATFRDGTLPGRLLVNAATGNAKAYDLQTGDSIALPKPRVDLTDNVFWSASTRGDKALRYVTRTGRSPFSVFDTRTWKPAGSDIAISSGFTTPRLSPDGRYLLTFWNDEAAGEGPIAKRLTVFDTATGRAVKRGSKLEGETPVTSPFDWLPAGSYVYLAWNRLYRSTVHEARSELLATLDLPGNSADQDDRYLPGATHISVSPDGRRIAFTWASPRAPGRRVGLDTDIWVVGIDGKGLHRLTATPDRSSALHFHYGSPTWSPDSRWVAGVLFMGDVTVTPVYPPDDTVAPAWQVAGATGCAVNPVFVLPADAHDVAIPWPRYDHRFGIKVKAPDSGRGRRWLSSCDSIAWLP